MKDNKGWIIGTAGVVIVFALFVGFVLITLNGVLVSVDQTTRNLFNPLTESNNRLNTQVAEILHPTPTILPDPVTIVNQIKPLARLETIQYSVEKVIRAEEGQDKFPMLFGDKMIFVAHGKVIAGIDLSKIKDQDIKINGKILIVNLPEPEIFVVTLENEKSYVYDRTTGLFTKGDPNLETQVRQAAEDEIRKAALSDGILEQARINGENYLGRMLRALDFNDVVFNYPSGGSH